MHQTLHFPVIKSMSAPSKQNTALLERIPISKEEILLNIVFCEFTAQKLSSNYTTQIHYQKLSWKIVALARVAMIKRELITQSIHEN